MWIAACDDDANFTGRLSEVLPSVISPNDHVSYHNGGMELLDAAHKARHPIDVLLLDMEMPGLSGIETALELRGFCSCTTIIVLTGHTKYALPCYDIRAFHYLIKPLKADQLKSAIDEARRRTGSREVMHICTKDADSFVPYGDIFYMESLNRSLYTYTRGNAYKSNRSISQTDAELDGKGFYRVHKSFIVNMEHVEHIDRSARIVWLSDGTKLPVGNRKLMDFASALLNYKSGRYG